MYGCVVLCVLSFFSLSFYMYMLLWCTMHVIVHVHMECCLCIISMNVFLYTYNVHDELHEKGTIVTLQNFIQFN